MSTCNEPHLSNIWSSIYRKVKQNWGGLKKCVAYKKVFISIVT